MATRNAWTPWIPVVLWVLVIAGLGGSGFHHSETSRIIGPLLEWLFPDWLPHEIRRVHAWIRKGAHVVEYAIAAVLIFRAIVLSWGPRTRVAAAIPTLLMVAGVAIADEVRQRNLANRTGSLYDVGLDITGGVFGLVIAPWFVRRRDESPEEGSDDHGG